MNMSQPDAGSGVETTAVNTLSDVIVIVRSPSLVGMFWKFSKILGMKGNPPETGPIEVWNWYVSRPSKRRVKPSSSVFSVVSLKMMSPEPWGSVQEVASVNEADENPVISIVASIAGSSSIGPGVTKTLLVSPFEVTEKGSSVNDVVPRVPVATPENVSVIG